LPHGDARLRQVSALEQRARALEAEIEIRKQLETSLRDALEERARAQANAEISNRLKDEFLATLSHELRTPLSAILGWAQVLGSNPDEQTMLRAIEVIKRNATLQLRLVEDLLDVSRIVAGKLVLTTEKVDLAMVVVNSLEIVRPSAAAKGIALGLRLGQKVPYVNGDPARLQQIVWNLLTNAIKFTPRHGRVELSLKLEDAVVEIVVRDTGQGIPPEFLPYIFDRFRQADGSSTRRHGGLGVGLAVVRYLTQAHGGTIRAESAGKGLGSRFLVSLPIAC
jgi:signal transduction histidine kinase